MFVRNKKRSRVEYRKYIHLCPCRWGMLSISTSEKTVQLIIKIVGNTRFQVTPGLNNPIGPEQPVQSIIILRFSPLVPLGMLQREDCMNAGDIVILYFTLNILLNAKPS